MHDFLALFLSRKEPSWSLIQPRFVSKIKPISPQDYSRKNSSLSIGSVDAEKRLGRKVCQRIKVVCGWSGAIHTYFSPTKKYQFLWRCHRWFGLVVFLYVGWFYGTNTEMMLSETPRQLSHWWVRLHISSVIGEWDSTSTKLLVNI
jgi:hypothetical protein